MIAGWVSLNICHSSCGRSIFFLFLKDFVVLRKLIVSPTYSCRARISETAAGFQLYGVAGRCAALRSMLAQYSEGVITFSAFRRFAICVGPRPSIHILKMRRTTSAAGSSISHLISGFFASGSFIYPKGGTVVSGKPDIPLLRNTLRTF